MSLTCSQFRTEILKLPLYQALICPFQSIMHLIFVDLRLHDYLDKVSIKNLRLVCKDLKTMIELCESHDRNCWRYSRWCETAGLIASTRIGPFTSSDEYELQPQASSIATLNIFNLLTQDLKRIFNHLSLPDLNSLKLVCRTFNIIVNELQLHSFKEYKDNFEQCNLMDLPSEIHKKILNLCSWNDRPNLRLVSKLMQYQVDTLAGVRVYMNDLKWNWNSNCGKIPPAYSLIIVNIENNESINSFISDCNYNLLTRLVLDGPFLSKAMILILGKCKNLQYIGFTYALQMKSLEDEFRKSFPQERLPLDLKALRALNLKIQETDAPTSNIFRVHAWTWTNAFEFLKPTLFFIPNLTSFNLFEESIFSHNLLYEVAEKVLKFIADHRYLLKHISVSLIGQCFRSCSCPNFVSQVPENELKQLRLSKYCHDCDWRISRPFTAILKAQRALQELTCFKLSDWEFYAGVIKRNCDSLLSVTIEKNLAPIIDLEVFATCNSLEYLWISQYGSINAGRSINNGGNGNGSCQIRSLRFDPRLSNLDKLPVSLKHLHILDQTAETSQIKTIPLRLKNLETLELQFLGSWNGKSFGLTTGMISEILQLRKLNCLFLEEIVAIDAYMFNSPLQQLISEVNLIPMECSQIIKSFGCVMYGILVAEKLPSPDFMPKWEERVTCYLTAEENDPENALEPDDLEMWQAAAEMLLEEAEVDEDDNDNAIAEGESDDEIMN
ncbi:hypothetical protein Ocin01_05347 [Orchesella cincta]|uniref:F-box domain-containing protein n=1 Tax=Orchesella cincta TaxID=48709 RepID=A0A1D2N8B5_ORCCI|nr:hypothetical protein Ocin01_05347 [Orchesella cincta]